MARSGRARTSILMPPGYGDHRRPSASLSAAPNFGVVAVHREPVTLDLMNVMSNELTVIGSMGYPTEIFEVTKDIVDNWEKYRLIISHTFGFDDLDEALRCVSTPGAADKVIITLD